jgi:UDP-GlcNAc:undecaprenyl-phosphate GlcNAc-1-phosphate transferase
LAVRCGLVDRPDGRRKLQPRPIPVAGGVAVLLATALSLGVVLAWSDTARAIFEGQGQNLIGLGLAALAICAVGVADDFGCLRGRHKFLGQLLAVGIVVAFGLQIRTLYLFDWKVELGLLSLPFTVFWLLGAINSLNLIDGMDGLLSSVGLIICLAVAAMAALGDRPEAACVAVALAGALLAFLRYNFPPASAFLGDAGSMLIGLVVGVLAIQSSLKGPVAFALAAPLAILTIPAFDTAAAIVRRKLTGRSIYSTDRGHLHHCLLRRGLSSRRVLLCISGCCLVTVLGALASLVFKNELLAILVSLAVIGSLIATRLFGYAEFLLVKERLAKVLASFVRLRGRQGIRHTEVHLQGSVEWKALVSALEARAFDLNLKKVRLNVNAPAIHESYHGEWDRFDDEDGETACLWRAEIPLAIQGQGGGRLEVTGYRDAEPIWKKVAAVTGLIEEFESGAFARAETNGAAVTKVVQVEVPARG